MPDTNKSHKPASLRFELPDEMLARMRQLSQYHGRTLSDESRRAFAIHDTQATLAYLETEDAKAELGDKLPDARAKVRADLAALITATYARRPEIEPPFGAQLN